MSSTQVALLIIILGIYIITQGIGVVVIYRKVKNEDYLIAYPIVSLVYSLIYLVASYNIFPH